MTDPINEPSPEPTDAQVTPRANSARSSALLAAGTLASRILGFVRTILLAATIGSTTNIADIFGVANQLPNTMYQLTAGGLLTAVLVPQIVQATRSADRGVAYINRVSTLAVVLFTASAAIATVASPLLIALYTHDWPPERVALAVAMAYICMPQLFFYGLYALLGGVLNARGVFGPYTWAPVLNNVIAILGLGLFLAMFGADNVGLLPLEAWAGPRTVVLAGSATLGVAAQALVLFVFLRKAGIRLRPDFTFRGVGLGATFVAAGWILGNVLVEAIVGVVQSNALTFAGSTRTVGDVALVGNQGIANVFLIYALPHSIVAVSIATVYFTRLSEHWAARRLGLFRADFSYSARLIGVATVLCTALLIVLSYPLVRFFSTGAFAQTEALARILIAMAFGLVGFSFFFVVMRALYSVDDTRSVFVITVISAIFRIPAFLLAMLADRYWIVVFVAGITTVAVWIEASVGFIILRRRVGPPGGSQIVRTHVRLLVAATAAGLLGFGVAALLGTYRPGGFGNESLLGSFVTLMVVGVVMTAVYGMMLRILRVRELDGIVALVRGRLRRG